jgi:hypothetical protein
VIVVVGTVVVVVGYLVVVVFPAATPPQAVTMKASGMSLRITMNPIRL